MIANQMTHIPPFYEEYQSEPLSEDDLKYFESVGLEKIWYWYATALYLGAGDLIGLKDGKHYHKDIGHCSCYGPTGTGINEFYNWEPCRGFASLDELLASASPRFREVSWHSLQALVEFIKGTKEGEVRNLWPNSRANLQLPNITRNKKH